MYLQEVGGLLMIGANRFLSSLSRQISIRF